MTAERISTADIRNIGLGGKLEVFLPNYAAIEVAKNLVSRCNVRYPRPDGGKWRTSIDRKTFRIVIYCEPKAEEVLEEKA